jgi:hypothetical protein
VGKEVDRLALGAADELAQARAEIARLRAENARLRKQRSTRRKRTAETTRTIAMRRAQLEHLPYRWKGWPLLREDVARLRSVR